MDRVKLFIKSYYGSAGPDYKKGNASKTSNFCRVKKKKQLVATLASITGESKSSRATLAIQFPLKGRL